VTVLTLVAEVIGFIVLALVLVLILLTLGSMVHEFIRSRSLAYDRYWYDDNARWNARRKRRTARTTCTGGADD
jgi:hypothetical protein